MMRVAFYDWSRPLKGLSDELFNIALKAVRRAMPYAEVWQLRGPAVPKHPGVDYDLPYDHFRRPEHHSLMDAKPTLFLDTDCYVQEDVFDVFYDDFDIATCVRQQYPMDDLPPVDRPRYNGGVTFSRSQKFWEDFAKYHAEKGWPWQDVYYSKFIGKSSFNVKMLHGSKHNYVPKSFDEDLSGRAIIHYKGEKRKYWMKHRDGRV